MDSQDDYPTMLKRDNKIELLESFHGAKQHHRMKCMTCNHTWTATPISKRQTYKKHGVGGCPNCNKHRRENSHQTTRAGNLQRLSDRGIEVLTKIYDGRHTTDKIKVRNTKCGHVFQASANNLLQAETECAVCGPSKRTSAATLWSKTNSAKWKETASEWQKYKAVVTSLTEQTYKTHKLIINPHNHPRGKAGQDGAYHLDHVVPKRFCFDNDIPPEVCADRQNLQMLEWRDNVGSRNHIKGTIPPIFFQYLPSSSRMDHHVNKLQRIFPNSVPHAVIAGVVVTLHIPELNRAIVVIPTDRTHANTKSGHHALKTLTILDMRVTVLFEDELVDVDLLTAKLNHYAHRGSSHKIHARQCEIRECANDEKRKLLDRNHVQGNDRAHVSYGAYYNDQLVAVMTFAKPRVALGQKGIKDRTGIWELSRFCTDVNFRIPGIASRMLTHFKRKHEWKEIYSYADKRWSVGNMYDKLGFSVVVDNPPDYHYVVDGVRKHRWNYRKDILKNTLPNYDPKLSEYQNMENHGFWRVWDCGTLKFSMKKE